MDVNKVIDGDGFESLGDKIKTVKYIATDYLSAYLYGENPVADYIVSHNSDGNIVTGPPSRKYDCEWIPEKVPKNLKVLYCQNCLVKDKRLQPIPIGLERVRWSSTKRPEIQKAMVCKKQSMCFVCHSVSTNPKERKEPYEIFKEASWVTLMDGKNGVDFKRYITNMANHIFVISPDGNGSDTHRTWEALCVGTIPIVKNRVWAKCLAKIFPMVLVDSWKQVTYQFLEREMVRLRPKMNYQKYLGMKFWEDLIKEEKRI